MSRIAVIAALPGEIAPLVEGWRSLALGDDRANARAWQGNIGHDECVAVAAGMGREPAARACAIAEQSGPLDALISVGWAGGLSCGLYPGTAYPVAEVVDAATGESFRTSSPPHAGAPLRLVTLDHVALAEEKRALAARYQAVLVDMEAAAVGRIARDKGIAFYCFKAVSDSHGDRLPDFSRYTNSQGGLRMPALLGHVAIRPKYWMSMARMGQNSRVGAEAVAQAVRDLIGVHADHVDA